MAFKSPNPSSKSIVTLIPWDPASAEHVQRLVLQRIACGWNYEGVEGWRTIQETGEFNLQWVVLDDSDPDRDTKVLKHTQAFPEEEEPLIDSAVSFGGKSRSISSPKRSFTPVGHICLGRVPVEYEAAGYAKNENGVYWISNFYISKALQRSGLGKAAMDSIEKFAVSEPLYAKTLALNTVDDRGDPEREEKYKAHGMEIPPVSNQEWYERRNYQVYTHAEKLFSTVDLTGKTCHWNAVFLRKNI
ncbi:hypothetical protein BGW36DRAFT_458730 [Talaromyces proteolyticus]|uniref:N-acetyltransferase domain-containing protein n=1 Tax=Talaromyces proteolyticus TaxID=1131652 RepID=A0AAD4PYU4_9EURO|nr:uncharacterized protein BGW36DRAFT_458730 [Talaromyces proteolyticus]KAH8701915.1 hypothetical protein BGW36DRAFT_458730 [Talaromyces proteolyticus]